MKRLRIDDTGIEFNSITELCEFLKCVPSNIWWWQKHHSDSKDHFICGEYGITILEHNRPDYYKSDKYKATRKRYYENNKKRLLDATKEWRTNHKDKVKFYKEKWRKEHQEWYNAYYREQRKKRKVNNLT